MFPGMEGDVLKTSIQGLDPHKKLKEYSVYGTNTFIGAYKKYVGPIYNIMSVILHL